MKRFHHRYTLPLILTLLVVAITALVVGFLNYNKDTTLPSNSNTSAIGVELDQRFDYVDLHKLEHNGISFVYLRSTQGKSYFDDNYLSYRDQIQGTNLAFGTSVYFSNESTAVQQYQYFVKKVGSNTGTLPVMIIPAVQMSDASYLKSMAAFARLLQKEGKNVVVQVDYKYHNYFPDKTQFACASKSKPDKLEYSFWQYTNDGRVNNVEGLEDKVTMFSYNGSITQYKQRYGQLTQ